MGDFDSLQPHDEITNSSYEQNPLPGQFTDFRDQASLSSELHEVFDTALGCLRDNPVLSADIRRMGERIVEVVEYPEHVSMFGTTKKTLDIGELKRVHSFERYEFKRNGPDREILKVSVLSLRDNPNAVEYVRRIEEDYSFNNDKASDKVSLAMQGVEQRQNLDVSFFDQSQVYREKATREAYRTIEDITFSFEDSEEREICAVVIKKTLGGVYISIIDFRNPDKARMFVTEMPVPLDSFDEKKFDSLKQRLSMHVKGIKRDFD